MLQGISVPIYKQEMHSLWNVRYCRIQFRPLLNNFTEWLRGARSKDASQCEGRKHVAVKSRHRNTFVPVFDWKPRVWLEFLWLFVFSGPLGRACGLAPPEGGLGLAWGCGDPHSRAAARPQRFAWASAVVLWLGRAGSLQKMRSREGAVCSVTSSALCTCLPSLSVPIRTAASLCKAQDCRSSCSEQHACTETVKCTKTTFSPLGSKACTCFSHTWSAVGQMCSALCWRSRLCSWSLRLGSQGSPRCTVAQSPAKVIF